MPTTTSADAARDAATQLIIALLNPHPVAPFAPMTGEQIQALRQLAEIFARTTGTTNATNKTTHAPQKDRKVSYVKPVATIRPNKAEVNQVRLTTGDDIL